ncbi:MAG: FHA domain-containing protein [Lachnospiraceae bacterium]|nr:FHA domain-containing protein [Lachnospiraceae bacterium]
MNLSRCANGHFFDKEKYAVCPHCNDGASDESLTTVFTEDTPGMGTGQDIFGGSPVFPVADLAADQFTVELDASAADSMTVPLEQPVPPAPMSSFMATQADDDDDDHTVGFFDSDLFGAPTGNTSSQSMATSQPMAAPLSVATSQPFASTQTPAMQQTVASQPAKAVTKPVNKVSTPCVGWVIALNGEHVGTDFRLKVGKNFIGRGAQMDIALTEDKSVSRDKHAIVVYEPKAHLYLMQPGESSSLVYKNDELVLSPVNLAPYDRITVGDVDLLFMPLCGEDFNWSDWFEKTKKRGDA